jgi:death-on-curing protein
VKQPPIWVQRQALLDLHEESLTQFGGARGIRDQGLLESALSRPENKLLYEPETTVYRLAAAYCFGIARNHPFVDGNKRSAFMAMGLFLFLNGYELEADPLEAEWAVLEIVESSMNEEELAAWLIKNTRSWAEVT